MFQIKRFYLYLILFFIFSCENQLKNDLSGLWVVESIIYNGTNLEIPNINTFSFGKGEKVTIPPHLHFSQFEVANYELIGNEIADSLVVKSQSDVFNNRFDLLFQTDPLSGTIYLKLISKNSVVDLQKVNLFENRNDLK